MEETPHIQDWFLGLMTPGQWFATYIVSIIVVWTLATVALRKVEPKQGGAASAGLAMSLLAFPLVFGAVLGVANFLSFMLFLIFSGV